MKKKLGIGLGVLIIMMLIPTISFSNALPAQEDVDFQFYHEQLDMIRLEAEKAQEELKIQGSGMLDVNENRLSDALDQKLEMIEDGVEKIPVIIEIKEAFIYDWEGLAASMCYDNIFELASINSFCAELTKEEILKLVQKDQIETIYYDSDFMPCMEVTNETTGINAIRKEWGLTGDRDGNTNQYSTEDIVIAVIDSGINANHQDLDEGKVLFFKDWTKRNGTEAYDDNGHGTHVSGIISGTGEANKNNQGIAPGSALVVHKVYDSKGNGPMSNVIKAIQWCIDNKDVYNIKVINLSIGTPSQNPNDPLCKIVNKAVRKGIICCVAAGSKESFFNASVMSPGLAKNAITVGSVADSGKGGVYLATFSGKGSPYISHIKPDVCAPGVNINSTDYATNDGYIVQSGSSMSTPYVSGVIALMLEANPELTDKEIKKILYENCEDFGPTGKDTNYGHGVLNPVKVIEMVTNKDIDYETGVHHFGFNYIFNLKKKEVKNHYFYIDDISKPIAINLLKPSKNAYSYFTYIKIYDGDNKLIENKQIVLMHKVISFIPEKVGLYKITLSAAGYMGGDVSMDISTSANKVYQQDPRKVSVEFYNQDTAIIKNTLFPNYRVVNNSEVPIHLKNLKLDYRFTNDGEEANQFFVDYSNRDISQIAYKFIRKKDDPVYDTKLVLSFQEGADILQPNEFIEIRSRIAKDDWSNFNQSNDISFIISEDYTYNKEVNAYIGDRVVK